MTDTTPRDQLAQIIYDTLNGQYGDFCIPDDAADAIMAAGWRPPARVEPGSDRCPTCGCELAYPTAIHVVDCGEGPE